MGAEDACEGDRGFKWKGRLGNGVDGDSRKFSMWQGVGGPSRLKSVSVIKLLQARGVGNKEDNCVGLGRRAIVVVGGYQVGCSVMAAF